MWILLVFQSYQNFTKADLTGALPGICVESGNEPLEVLKLRVNLSTQEARRALAISDNRKNHSYGEILQSSFQLSSLLQTLCTVDHQRRPLVKNLNEADEARANDGAQEVSGNLGVCVQYFEVVFLSRFHKCLFMRFTAQHHGCFALLKLKIDRTKSHLTNPPRSVPQLKTDEV